MRVTEIVGQHFWNAPKSRKLLLPPKYNMVCPQNLSYMIFQLNRNIAFERSITQKQYFGITVCTQEAVIKGRYFFFICMLPILFLQIIQDCEHIQNISLFLFFPQQQSCEVGCTERVSGPKLPRWLLGLKQNLNVQSPAFQPLP